MKQPPAEKVLLSSIPASPDEAQPKKSTKPRAGRTAERETGWRPKENVLEIASALGRFDTFGRAIQAAGMTNTLSGRGPFTIFAPTDKAFAKLPPAELNALFADPEALRTLLANHVVPSTVRAPRRQAPAEVTTLDGRQLDLRVVPEDGGYQVGDARIVKTNIRASNGVIHAINTVLTPR